MVKEIYFNQHLKHTILRLEQPTVRVIDKNGKDWGVKKVTSFHWDSFGDLWIIMVDFMEDDSKGSPFYKNAQDEYINRHGNLTAIINI